MNNRRKKVAVIFVYLQNNLGDDLFLEHLCLRYPDVDFYAMSSDVKNATLEALDNLYFSADMRKYFKEFELPEVSKKARKFYNGFDACVVVGGSIFMQFNQNWRPRLKSFKNRTSLNKNTYVLGANFGPFTSAEFLNEHVAVFAGIKDMCFRDTFSAAYFPDLPNVRCAPDILFSYKHDMPEQKNKVAISLVNGEWDGRPVTQLKRLKAGQKIYNKKIVELCSELALRGVGISLLSFCDRQGDLNIAKAIEAECLLNGVTDIEVHSYTGDAKPILDELAGARAVVATRFHSMVLGFLFGKPVYPIIYDDKQRYVLQDLNFYGDSTTVEDIGSIDVKAVADVLLSPDTKNTFDKAFIDRIRADAEKQFAGLDEILKREV